MQVIKQIENKNSTFFKNDVSFRAVNLLSANQIAGGISEVDEVTLCMEVQSSRVHQVLDGDHVFILNFRVDVHTTDNAWTTLAIH